MPHGYRCVPTGSCALPWRELPGSGSRWTPWQAVCHFNPWWSLFHWIDWRSQAFFCWCLCCRRCHLGLHCHPYTLEKEKVRSQISLLWQSWLEQETAPCYTSAIYSFYNSRGCDPPKSTTGLPLLPNPRPRHMTSSLILLEFLCELGGIHASDNFQGAFIAIP